MQLTAPPHPVLEPSAQRSLPAGDSVSKQRPRLLRRIASIVLLLSLVPSQAAAFCRQRSCQDSVGDPKDSSDDIHCQVEDGCVVDGEYLHRASPCLTYGIDKGTAEQLDLTDAEFDDVVMEAFDRWENVDCGDGAHPDVLVQSVGAVVVPGKFSCEKLPEENLAVWTLLSPWNPPGCDPTGSSMTRPACKHSESALGYTSSRYDKKNDVGLVVDSDVELNLARIAAFPSIEAKRKVLLSVVTHEAGHFLGLAHTQSRNTLAIMATSYSDDDLLSERQMDPDDIAGICSIFPPSDKRLKCSEPGYVEAALSPDACDAAAAELKKKAAGGDDAGCSVAQVGTRGTASSGMLSLLPLLAGLAFARRKRRN